MIDKVKLWEDFLDLGEKHASKEATTQMFGGVLLTYTFKMLFDTAPNREAVKELTEAAMQEAWNWHNGECTCNDKEEVEE